MGRRQILRCPTADLRQILLEPTGGRFIRPLQGYDEVHPGILIGDVDTALSTLLLREMGVTHVLNAAQGRNDRFYGGFVNTKASYYRSAGIAFLGIPALDMPSFYIKPYFWEAADFIEEATESSGKVLVHCQCGISRSATLVAAYLMIKKGLTVQEALSTIRNYRSIFPNPGFLTQLSDLDYELRTQSHSNSTTPESEEAENSLPTKPASENTYFPRFVTNKGYNSKKETSLIRPTLDSLTLEMERRRARSEERLGRYRPPTRDLTPVPKIIPESLSSTARNISYLSQIRHSGSNDDLYKSNRRNYKLPNPVLRDDPLSASKIYFSTSDLYTNTGPRFIRASSVSSLPAKFRSFHLKERAYAPTKTYEAYKISPVEVQVYEPTNYDLDLRYSRYSSNNYDVSKAKRCLLPRFDKSSSNLTHSSYGYNRFRA